MSLPEISTTALAPGLRMCRLLNGMWQVSGGHGRIDPEVAIDTMLAYHDMGLTTWDLADHYGPAEDFIGEFRRRLRRRRGDAALTEMQAFTKWVPRPGPMTRPMVETSIDRSLQRMDVSTLDLLQFHWWEYADQRYLDALQHLADLREAGKIAHLALTNFDTEHLRRITEHGIRIVSNQVQYSLVDLRPEIRMAPYCEANAIQLLTYGTLCGGLLSEAYLDRPEPGGRELATVSLRKYKQMIDAWGGWKLFQDLLRVLKRIADKHAVSLANVAVRAILDRPAVGGVIIGVRLGLSDHCLENARVFGFALDAEDGVRIQAVLQRARNLMQVIGDCGDEYRR